MKVEFQLLDCDYIILDNAPIVRLFGKTQDDKSICVFYRGYYPYFYVLPKKGENVKDTIKKKFPNLIVKIEYVSRFLPIGYQKDKTNILKIVLNDPSRVPEVRDSLEKEKFIQEIYEADILFRYRFLSDYGLSGYKWIRAEGTPIKTDTVKTNIKIEADSLEEVDIPQNTDLRYMAIDIETISNVGVPDSRKDIIGMISFSFSPKFNKFKELVIVSKNVRNQNENVKSFGNEKDMLQEFLKIVEMYDPDIIAGYNINNFDFPYILERLKKNNLPSLLGRCNQKPAQSRKFGNYTRNTATGRVIVDPYLLIKEAIQKSNLRLKRLGLGDVSKELLNDTKVNVSHSEITTFWNGTEEQIKKLIEYSEKDSKLVIDLLDKTKFLDKFFELSKISGLIPQDCLDGGEAQRVENLLLKEFNRNEFVLPCKPQGIENEEAMNQELKGALVLDPTPGLHSDSIVYLDFKSMYPSIFIAYNICPTTLLKDDSDDVENSSVPFNTKFVSKKVKEGMMPKIIKKLIEERDKTRDYSRKTQDDNVKRSLEAKQQALKIMTNAFYGYTGYVRARLYIIDIANTITGCGRYLINRTKDIVEKETSYKVVYGDTDSIMVKIDTDNLDTAFEKGTELEKLINKDLSDIVQIKIEKVFKTLLILSKKRYAGLSFEKSYGEWKEEIVMKGIETVRRDWCDLATKTLFDVLNILLREKDQKKAFSYVKGTLSKIEKNEIPIEDLIITKSISKSLSSYKGIQPHTTLVKKMKKRAGTAPGVGDRVSFVIVKGLQILSERAEDPEYIKKNNIPIDAKYYVENQILPPLERVLEVLGYSKTELLGLGKQTLLKDLFKVNGINTNGNNSIEPSLSTYDNLTCLKCGKSYRRLPLIGKCSDCQGEIVFSYGDKKSRIIETLPNVSKNLV